MKDFIELYKDVVVQIATPHNIGTGFYLKKNHIIITNEHVIHDNKEVTIEGETFERQIANVIYTDPRHDLAFIKPLKELNTTDVKLGAVDILKEGDTVIAVGHPFGLKYSATKGIISNMTHQQNDLNYFQHDAALNPGNSGGPLIDQEGRVVGVNTFIIKDGNSIGFSLPINYLKSIIEEFQPSLNNIGTRCPSCTNIVFETNPEDSYCPHCGTKIQLISKIKDYEPVGVPKTLEELLKKTGHDVRLARRGPNAWQINQGSAKINIYYNEKTGLIIGDAYLCNLPKKDIAPIYKYLLRENHSLSGLTFSVKEQDIVLSLLIYDQYLNEETGMKLFKHLFDKADDYDNILVEQYGAVWKNEDEKA